MFNEPLKIQKTQKKANRVTEFNNVLTLLSDFPSTEEGSLAKPDVYLAYSDRYLSVCLCASDMISPPPSPSHFTVAHSVFVFAFTRMEDLLFTRSFKYSENTIGEIKEVDCRVEEEEGSSSRIADFYGAVNHSTSSHIWL
jgi:hypothetical protein